jgi:hypothetical protein
MRVLAQHHGRSASIQSLSRVRTRRRCLACKALTLPLTPTATPPISLAVRPHNNMYTLISPRVVICTLAFTSAAVLSQRAHAQEFDWRLLNGKWAESTDHQFGCRVDNLHQKFELSSDQKTLKFKNDRLWKIGTGVEVREYSASVVKAQGRSLFIKYGPELQGIPPEYREWEMRFIGPGTYRWRAVHWAADEFNNVIGVKCEQ